MTLVCDEPRIPPDKLSRNIPSILPVRNPRQPDSLISTAPIFPSLGLIFLRPVRLTVVREGSEVGTEAGHSIVIYQNLLGSRERTSHPPPKSTLTQRLHSATTMSGPVPTVTALQDIYTNDAVLDQGVRWNKLLEKFQSIYGRPAQFVSRSPGRVNIIGEHIDYSLYSVLPMGMTPDVIIAVSTDLEPSSKDTYKLKLANLDEGRFPTREFDVPHGEVEIDATKHEWTNYFKAGLRGALELLRKKHGVGFNPKSMQVLMDGTVPAGGGLSSSAAFVSASALAVMIANGEKDVDKKDLTEVAIVSERAVGVNSGG